MFDFDTKSFLDGWKINSMNTIMGQTIDVWCKVEEGWAITLSVSNGPPASLLAIQPKVHLVIFAKSLTIAPLL